MHIKYLLSSKGWLIIITRGSVQGFMHGWGPAGPTGWGLIGAGSAGGRSFGRLASSPTPDWGGGQLGTGMVEGEGTVGCWPADPTSDWVRGSVQGQGQPVGGAAGGWGGKWGPNLAR